MFEDSRSLFLNLVINARCQQKADEVSSVWPGCQSKFCVYCFRLWNGISINLYNLDVCISNAIRTYNRQT